MPDWNPAEMTGQNPENLSYSLYKKLITDDSWRIARKLMGYNFPQEKNLMKLFSGKPYINTRLSFNSFLPMVVNSELFDFKACSPVIIFSCFNLFITQFLLVIAAFLFLIG